MSELPCRMPPSSVGLWSLVERIRRAGATDDSNILKTTLDFELPFLSEGAVIAGQFVRDDEFHATPFDGYEFHQWTMPPRQAIAKIEAERRELGRDPNIGEMACGLPRRGKFKLAHYRDLSSLGMRMAFCYSSR